jgi:hypothetical protein
MPANPPRATIERRRHPKPFTFTVEAVDCGFGAS